nr:translation factor GUF1 homolog, mitochondrial [Tanacetum cinerariifolium]
MLACVTGQVGYVVSGMRFNKETRIEDTLSHTKTIVEPLACSRRQNIWLFSGLFPANTPHLVLLSEGETRRWDHIVFGQWSYFIAQLQQKVKQEEQLFRQWKANHEKQLMQVIRCMWLESCNAFFEGNDSRAKSSR